MSTPTYDATVATSLQQLAALAMGNLSNVSAGLPQPWGLVSTASGRGIQAFTAIGRLYGSTNQIALALGGPWTSWLNAYSLNGNLLVQQNVSSVITNSPTGSSGVALHTVDEVLDQARTLQRWALADRSDLAPVLQALRLPETRLTAGKAAGLELDTDPPTFDLGTQQLYLASRSAIWSAVSQAAALVPHVNQTDLLICGQGLGAGFAQLAAYDLRPDKTGITLEFAQIRLYAFSAPELANSTFAEQFAASVPDAWAVSAGTSTIVDFFPTQPTTNVAGIGTAQPLAAWLPEVDAPWFERSGVYYGDILDGGSTAADPKGASVTSASGFSADLAFTLSQLCGAAALRAQHPDLSPVLPSSWSLTSALPDDNPWVCLFTRQSPKGYALVFRSGTTMQETAKNLASSGPSTLDWLEAGSAAMHAGAYSIYTDTLRDDLRSMLQGLDWSGGATLTLSGHSLGALIASVAAVDLNQNPVSGAPSTFQTYCFGCPASAGYSLLPVVPVLRSSIYLVSRTQDTVAATTWNNLLTAYGTPVTLSGTTGFDGDTFHAINAYIALLDPTS